MGNDFYNNKADINLIILEYPTLHADFINL